MNTVGITMVKDEADIIGYTLAHMLTQVDALIVADNGSTDDTRAVIEAVRRISPVVLVDDPDPAYYQSHKMTRLAHMAADTFDADWVVPFDADEWWTSKWGTVAETLEHLPDTEGVATAQLFDHVATGEDDADEPDPFRRIGWRRRKPVELPKVAARTRATVTIEAGNHGAHFGVDRTPNPVLEVRHFQNRSAEHFVRKVRNGAAAYRATDLPDDVGAHWRQYGTILDEQGEDALRAVFTKWFYVQYPAQDTKLVYDPVA